MFVRHGLNALYSDLNVVLNKVKVEGAGSDPPATVLDSEAQPGSDPNTRGGKAKGLKRDKRLFIGLTVHGIATVTGQPGELTV